MSGEPVLTEWAADCAERALVDFGDLIGDDRPARAISAARAWVASTGSLEKCLDAALEAQLAAREVQDAGYQALAVAVRAAAAAAASADDSRLAGDAAALSVEALTLNSAPCEQQSVGAGERRRQWQDLPEAFRPVVFGNTEPPLPAPAACSLD